MSGIYKGLTARCEVTHDKCNLLLLGLHLIEQDQTDSERMAFEGAIEELRAELTGARALIELTSAFAHPSFPEGGRR